MGMQAGACAGACGMGWEDFGNTVGQRKNRNVLWAVELRGKDPAEDSVQEQL